MQNYLYVPETDSTNGLMKTYLRKENLPHGFVIHTGFQTAGRGQGTNSWESALNKNLLFSLLLRPQHIELANYFLISQIISVGILRVLQGLVNLEQAKCFSIKWPNDIYWQDKKIGGILIENSLQGKAIQYSICGIGININQHNFISDAPNPISLSQITGEDYDVDYLLNKFTTSILEVHDLSMSVIQKIYHESLYRNKGYHPFKTTKFTFCARIVEVKSDGSLILEDKDKVQTAYYFKEIAFVID